MCTAFGIFGSSLLFGRTLDLDRSLGEGVVITPKNFPLRHLYRESVTPHYAIVGAAVIKNGAPLYFDGVNEWGLCMAGLNFPESARYKKYTDGRINIASFELIPYILSTCKSAEEAKRTLAKINITDDCFSAELPASPIHWIIADGKKALVAEPMESGLCVYDDQFYVLTNEPPLPYHLYNVRGYMGLSPDEPKNSLCPSANLRPYSNGSGALGLTGDFSSPSRFVRAVFMRSHCEVEDGNELEGFFHVADTLSVPSGCVIDAQGGRVRTVYSCCMSPKNFSYHFTTYGCRSIRSVYARPYLEGSALTELSMNAE